MRIEVKAIEVAKRYHKRKGFEVSDVSRAKGHNGYDLLLKKGRRTIRMEVKGCSRQWQIPDLFGTEVVAGSLVADQLCVVYFPRGADPTICIIPRRVFAPTDFQRKTTYRINSRKKKETVLGEYARPLRKSDLPV